MGKQGYGQLQQQDDEEQQQQQQKQHQQKQQQQHGDPSLLESPSFSQVVQELRALGRIAVPITAMNCVVYIRAMVSVLCLGRLGGLQLAGGALSIGFTNITGYSVLFGLASGMDPICSQAFGSRNFPLIGLSLRRTMLILLTACIPISALWLNLERILLALGQDASITSVARIYCLWSLPDLLANTLIQPLRVYLRSQGVTSPLMWCSAAAVLLHVPLNWLLVFVLGLGVPGVALAAVLTNFNMAVLLGAYLWWTGACSGSWGEGWAMDAVREWGPLLALALPSCCAICLEWWWYEIMTLLAGYLPQPREAVATTAILIQTTSLMYTLPLALSAGVSTRVGNELGGGRPAAAKLAALVALGCAEVVATLGLAWTIALRHQWGKIFTADGGVLALTAAAMPIMGLCELGNCPQTTGCGVLRGSARPAVGATINLGSFYLVGTPIAVALAFWFKVGFGGLWYGLLAAQVACAASVLYVVLRTDWELEACRARSLAASSSGAKLQEMAKMDKELHEAEDQKGEQVVLVVSPAAPQLEG